MRHDAEKLLIDILAAARDIQQFVGEMSFDDYHANRLVKAAVERKFEVIGEALNRLARPFATIGCCYPRLREDHLLSKCRDPWLRRGFGSNRLGCDPTEASVAD